MTEILIYRLKTGKEYLPIITENFLCDRITNLKEITLNMSETEVTLKYDPIGYGKFRYTFMMNFFFLNHS